MGMRRLASVLLRLYPPATRDRYGTELLDLLEHSDRPLRDSVDLVVHALAERADAMVRPAWVRRAAVVLAGMSLVMLGYAVNDLSHGIGEVGDHWWSAAAAGFALVTLTLAALSASRSARPS